MTATAFRPQRAPLVAAGAVDHQAQDLTVTAAADVTLATLQQKLAEYEQWLAIDGDPNHTLGELVETNSTGPLRLGFGAWRDLLLGVQFTTPSGKFITAGAATMKNVAALSGSWKSCPPSTLSQRRPAPSPVNPNRVR